MTRRQGADNLDAPFAPDDSPMIISPRFASIAFAFSISLGLLNCGGGLCEENECTCDGGSCDFVCPQGNCNQNCTDDADCTVSCEGGGCQQSCTGEASCTFECEGGGCSQSCAGTGTCNATCAGNDCLSF